jgi:AbiV family abortive infection protein
VNQAIEDERTLIIANAARLLADAKLLADHARFASGFALTGLGVEEIGKVILDIWATAEPLAKPKLRKSSHICKQSAVGSLLLASFAVKRFGIIDAHITEIIMRNGLTDQSVTNRRFCYKSR